MALFFYGQRVRSRLNGNLGTIVSASDVDPDQPGTQYLVRFDRTPKAQNAYDEGDLEAEGMMAAERVPPQ